MKPSKLFLCIGHRGASGLEPENTLLSIRRALELGARGIEIDVRLSQDGELMVIHDSSLHRTTGATGSLAKKSFAELRALDAGKGERIPTLREVLDEIAAFSAAGAAAEGETGGRCAIWLNIELKGRGTAEPVEREMEAAVARGDWRFRDITVSSFHYRELARLRHPETRVGVLIARAPLRLEGLLRRFRASSLHFALRLATPRFLAKVRRVRDVLGGGEGQELMERPRPLALYVYTVNEQGTMEWLREQGVDGVFTDFPDRFPFSEREGLPGGGQPCNSLEAKE